MTQIDIETSAVQRVLLIVAHPDDIESWAAGTVCRFVDAGRQVAFVLCTSGDKGASTPTRKNSNATGIAAPPKQGGPLDLQ